MTSTLAPLSTPRVDGPSPVDHPAENRARRLPRGHPDDPAWVRPALLTLLFATGVLYLWGLGASGWANSYYSAAVQAGTKSWKAAFFGSSDASNFITVDKSPASLWVMEASARLFGFNAWSVLVPQALEGVAAVGVLYAAVRRWAGPFAGLLAGTVMALTPAAVLMFRFNNPDALLVLLLTLAAYATVRALEAGRTRWVVLVGACIGFGFLAKMLQAFVVVPGFGLVYLIAAPGRLGRRVWQLGVALAATLVSAGWWMAAVQLTPAGSRPYIGGSQDNSLWNLMWGYNGLGRLTGNEAGSVGGGGAGTGRWGATGLGRMFNAEFGGQVSWLLPAAGIVLVAGLVLGWRAPRTDRTRASLLLWGSWLVATGVAFSLSKGIIHPYYSVALAPAVGALVGIGSTILWRRRDHPVARGTLALALAVTSWWSWKLLGRTPTWLPGLGTLILVVGMMTASALLLAPSLRGRWRHLLVAIGLTVGLAGPAAYSVATAAVTHSGAIPTAGSSVAGGFGGPGGPGGPGGMGGGGMGGGGMGGLLDASATPTALAQLLEADAGSYSWVAATVRSNQAAGYQLSTGQPVMAIGGFNGTDPAPSLARFQALVAAHRIHYFIGGSSGGFGGASTTITTATSTADQIASWVSAHYTAQSVGGVTVYDLTR